MIEQHVFILNSLAFPKIMRGFFGPIIKFLYYSIAKLVDFMYDLADGNLGLNSQIVDEFSDKFFLILIIFMIFKLTFSLINYLVDPAAFSDNKKGFSNIIKRIIISVALLVSINPIFSLLGDIQKTIISEDIISNYILYTSNDKVSYYQIGDKKYYATKMDPNCDEQRYIFSNSIGDRFSVLALRPFYQLTPLEEVDDVTEHEEFIEESDYCGASVDVFGQLSTSEEMAIQKINATLKNTKTSASELLTASIYNDMSGNWDPTHDETFYVNFNYFWALIVGIVVCLFIITICFDVVIRALSLFFYQIIAPLPIIMYVSPNGKESEMLSKWFKSTVSVWVSLFIKIAALSLGLYFCGLLCDSLNNDSYGLIKQIVVIIGTLMFAKKFPKLLEELIPGLKLGGMELNPFKRISKDALGGNMLLGAGAGLAAAGMSGLTNGIQRAGQTIGNVKRAEGARGKLGAAVSGLGRTAGSTITGATRGGLNAFGRTSKDGKIFSGAWNGYQTSMFSKKLREDNLRKAGLEGANVLERAKFGIGSMTSDLARYAGILNKGQREDLIAAEEDADIKRRQDALDLDKYNLSQSKAKALEPYQQYAGYASKIKSRIDNSKDVKDAEKELENARAIGLEGDIRIAEQTLDETKARVAHQLYNTDDDVKDLVDRMNKIRNSNEELKLKTFAAFKYNEDKQQYEFDSKSIYSTQNQASIIERTFEDSEREFKIRQEQINEDKRNYANNDAHNPMSQAKLQNSSRINPNPEKAGFKATPNQSAQSNISDSSMYSNLGRGSRGSAPPPGGHS